MVASLQQDHVTNAYGFIFTSTKPYNNQTWQNGRPAWTETRNLAGKMRLPQLVHMTNVYRSISTCISSITIKRVKMVDQHALISPCRYDDAISTTSDH